MPVPCREPGLIQLLQQPYALKAAPSGLQRRTVGGGRREFPLTDCGRRDFQALLLAVPGDRRVIVAHQGVGAGTNSKFGMHD